MRVALFAVACVAAAALVPLDAARGALATAASTLLEAAPLLVGSHLVVRLAGNRQIAAFLGCGCGDGPAARSLPAAAATWLVFGPAVAAARFLAALAVARLLRAIGRVRSGCALEPPDVLADLAAIVPAALLAGAVSQIAAWSALGSSPRWMQAVSGGLLGFAAPCGLGAIAVAGALRQRAPVAAAAYLCVAGIADARAFAWFRHGRSGPDATGYAVLAAALFLVGLRHGGALVHPGYSGALMAAGGFAAVAAVRDRFRHNAPARVAPLIMLAGALIAAPAPAYLATESTLTDAFAGEHLSFTGALVRQAHAAALVRYAITCCRADASPVVVRLAHVPAFAAGTWLHAEGTLAIAGSEVRLVAASVERVPAPSDPFTYR